MSLAFEHFTDRVGQSFPATMSMGEQVELLLVKADERRPGPHVAPGFSLEFLVEPDDASRPQQLVVLEHPEVGTHPIFVVPVDRDERGTIYQSVFSFLPDHSMKQ